MNRYFHPLLLISLAIPLFLGSCGLFGGIGVQSTHRPFQPQNSVRSLASTEESIEIEKVWMGCLEFDDQGEPWRFPDNGSDSPVSENAGVGPTQLEPIVKKIRELSQKGGVRTVIYIHGWNNNAAPDNSNYGSFKEALKVLAAVSDEPVVGVYVSWRGRVLPVSTYVDVGSREAAAARIGRGPLLSSLRAISAASHMNTDSRVIAIGHSFGAKILAQVTSNHLSAQFGTRYGNKSRSPLTPLADTVILANTAENAIIPRHMIGMMRDFNATYVNDKNKRPLPLVVSISTTNDFANERLLPTWNAFARFVGLPYKSGATSSSLQRHASHNAMGFEGSIQSHTLFDPQTGKRARGRALPWKYYYSRNPAKENRLEWSGKPYWVSLIKENFALGTNTVDIDLSPNPDKLSRDVLKLKFVNAIQSDGTEPSKALYSLRFLGVDDSTAERYRRGGVPNDTPFWAIQVPPFVVDGHNGFWNPNFMGFVAAIEGMGQRSKGSTSLPDNKATLRTAPSL